tara:strand:+ start:466 stop:1176 length:711 start_codon:yes stop_codon:yes gene_type:complete
MFSQGVVMIHVMRDGQQFGPYTIEDINTYLAQGTLLPTDQAWYEGAANWMPITEVPGVVHGAAPALVVAEADPMAAANPEVAIGEAGAAAAAVGGAKKKKLIIIGGSVAGVVAIAGVLLFVYPGFLKDDEADGGGGGINGGGASGGGQNFAGIVEPIFKKSTCYDCHDAATAKGSFNLDDPASVQEAIAVGDSDGSELVKRLVDPTEDVRMPPKGDMLPATDVQKIKDWIAAGAQF